MTEIPKWLRDIQEVARPAMVAFRHEPPDGFLFQDDGERWFDWPDLFGIPVYNVRFSTWWVTGDEDVPLLPIWKGELTNARESMIREFQCRYAKTGDF